MLPAHVISATACSRKSLDKIRRCELEVPESPSNARRASADTKYADADFSFCPFLGVGQEQPQGTQRHVIDVVCLKQTIDDSQNIQRMVDLLFFELKVQLWQRQDRTASLVPLNTVARYR
eukprot:2903940-Rhodomonas_salina.1